MSEPVACPACGAASLATEGAGEVCGVCGWPDEATARAEPDRESRGGVSLNEARANVAAFGMAYPPSEVGGS